jgi:hypothetical protein
VGQRLREHHECLPTGSCITRAKPVDRLWRFTALVAFGAAILWSGAHALGWTLAR